MNLKVSNRGIRRGKTSQTEPFHTIIAFYHHKKWFPAP